MKRLVAGLAGLCIMVAMTACSPQDSSQPATPSPSAPSPSAKQTTPAPAPLEEKVKKTYLISFDEAAQAELSEQAKRDLVEPVVTKYGGTIAEVRTMGTGGLVVTLESALDEAVVADFRAELEAMPQIRAAEQDSIAVAQDGPSTVRTTS